MAKLNKRLTLLEQKMGVGTEEYEFESPYLRELAAEFAAQSDEDEPDYTGMTWSEIMQLQFSRSEGRTRE